MTFQSTVYTNMGAGAIGETYLSGPHRGKPGIIDSDGSTYPNTVGYAFTQVSGSDGHCTVGGAISNGTPFYGILANPKNYPLYGTSGDTLAASMDLPQNYEAEFIDMTSGMWVELNAAAVQGDIVDYVSASGVLVPRHPKASVTATLDTGTLTVTAVDTNSAPLQVGMTVYSATLVAGATITALGTGTGGAGTYSVDDATTAVASAETFTADSLPADGNVEITPVRARVERFSTDGTGLALISLT